MAGDCRPLNEQFHSVLVVGLGKTGRAVCEALESESVPFRVYERDETPPNKAWAAEAQRRGTKVTFGEPDTALIGGVDLVVPSPGVPPGNPLLAEALARSVPVLSEIELAWRIGTAPMIAITGTNGKTTTTTLTTAILRTAGIAATSCGNIGFPLIEAQRRAAAREELVCEVSSFQLAFTDGFHPAVAVVTNVAPDHYDWHSGYSDYLASKAKITAGQRPGDLLVVSARDAGAMQIAASSKADIAAFGWGSAGEVRKTVEERIGREAGPIAAAGPGEIEIEQGGRLEKVVSPADIRLEGVHNLENTMAACLAARSRGAGPEALGRAVADFEGLAHRSKFVAERKGVRFIDDSKATNPHAAVAACRGLRNVVLIAGGRAKGLDLTALGEARPSLKAVVVMGEAAESIARVFDGVRCYRARDVEEAVQISSRLARPGDTVLLSPGCSSLDQYADYSERGDRFIAGVMSLEH